MIAVAVVLSLIGLTFGFWIGAEMEACYWRAKGNDDFRTAVYCRGEFFYVVPESEYVSMHGAAIGAGWKPEQEDDVS